MDERKLKLEHPILVVPKDTYSPIYIQLEFTNTTMHSYLNRIEWWSWSITQALQQAQWVAIAIISPLLFSEELCSVLIESVRVRVVCTGYLFYKSIIVDVNVNE